MESAFKVFVVDDDPAVRSIICAILEPDYPVDAFESAEACAAQLETTHPDLILLDINLPGMDGYALCRQLKGAPETRAIRVMFVSAHEGSEERIAGYDAGGDDFIVKPFEPEELLRKVKLAQHMILNQRTLAEQIEEAEHLSSLVMASMDETGILLQFMSKLIAMESAQEIAQGVLDLLHRYRLGGVVQTRLGGETLTLSAAGTNLPLETSVIEHVRDQGRIFEFSRRSVHNFERVTLMINQLPLDDPDYCGRLRDHLSVAAQGVDSRLKALQAEESSRRAQEGIRTALENVGNTIMELHIAHRENAEASSALIVNLQETLLNSFYKLGLTDNQEEFLQNMVGDFMAQMVALLDRGIQTQDALSRLSNQLADLRQH